MDDCIPVNLRVGLPFPEYAGKERPILLGMQILEPRGEYQLFADSSAIKNELRSIIQARWGFSIDSPPEFVHPNVLEAATAIATITFFERADCEYQNLWMTPRIIENDNWGALYWAFIRLLESGDGFIAKWSSMLSERQNARRYRYSELDVQPLDDGSGESYRTVSGELLLSHRHIIVAFKARTQDDA